MAKDNHGDSSTYSKHMRGVAFSILVMGLSMLGIIIAYMSFGYIGPNFSAEILDKQQAGLRKEFGLPARAVITNDTILLIPPSLRNSIQNNASS